MVFKDYASYYNALYQDKDYEKEAKDIHELIQCYQSGAQTILELGSGTGRHAHAFSQKGYKIHGIELSEDMLNLSEAYIKQNQVTFSQGDIRDFKLEQPFDCAVSLFHVMNYQTQLSDLKKVFNNVRQHLKSHGLFIFESWFGPAVLSQTPEVRVKRIQFNEHQVTRIAEPVMHPLENQVDVHYTLFIENKTTGQFNQIKEKHSMRYLFKNDVELLAESAGFTWVDCFEALSRNKPSLNSWSVVFVLRA